MKKILAFIGLAIVLIFLGLILERHRRVLDSVKLETDINNQIPLGTPKSKVIEFIQSRKPFFIEDAGSELKVRFSGLADNLVYEKDVVITFDFDPEHRVLRHSTRVTLTFF